MIMIKNMIFFNIVVLFCCQPVELLFKVINILTWFEYTRDGEEDENKKKLFWNKNLYSLLGGSDDQRLKHLDHGRQLDTIYQH